MNSAQQTSWGPQPAAIVVLAIGGVLMGFGCVMLVTDVPGRVVTGVAAVGLLVFASTAWRAQPKLAIVDDGLQLGTWLGTKMLPRDEVKLIRLTQFRRHGRRVRMLEVETVSDRLYVFTRWDLGTDPIQAFDALVAAGYTAPPPKR